MNRRQRKEHRIGEFQERGFELRFLTPSDWPEAQQLVFRDTAIEKIEALELAIGGGTDRCWNVFVVALGARDTVSPAQRRALVDWLSTQPAVSALQVGPLKDAWHDHARVSNSAA